MRRQWQAVAALQKRIPGRGRWEGGEGGSPEGAPSGREKQDSDLKGVGRKGQGRFLSKKIIVRSPMMGKSGSSEAGQSPEVSRSRWFRTQRLGSRQRGREGWRGEEARAVSPGS